MTKTKEIAMKVFKKEGFEVKIDLERPEACIFWRGAPGEWRGRGAFEEWEPTPFQTSALPIESRNAEEAWKLVDDWLTSESDGM